jgi:hypothetical protein
MLPFEIAVAVCCAAVAFALAIFGRVLARRLLILAIVAPLLLVVWHLRIEHRHWQMYPCFAAALILLSVVVSGRYSAAKIRMVGAASLVLIAGSVAVATVLPMFHLPKATGPYAVGTRTIHVVDHNRRETHVKGAEKLRELNIQVWYPTTATSGPQAPYRRPAETTLLSSYQAGIETGAFEDVPVAAPRGPDAVVVFNHAWNGLRTQDTFETIDLASHGFIVVSIDHTYNAIRTAFPDGSILTGTSSGDIDDFNKESPASLFERANAELQVETADVSFVLDTLQQWNEDSGSPFYGKVDLSRVAAMGHSFGGAVAIQSAISDRRVRAAINMDGWVFGAFPVTGMRKPLLQMISDEPYPTDLELSSKDPTVHGTACFDGIFVASVQSSFQKNGGYLLRLRGTKHMDFSDRPLYSPFRRFTSSGTDEWETTAADIRSYTLLFLRRTLFGSDRPMSSDSSAKPNSVELTEWRAGDPDSPILFKGSLKGCGVANMPSNMRSVAQKSN